MWKLRNTEYRIQHPAPRIQESGDRIQKITLSFLFSHAGEEIKNQIRLTCGLFFDQLTFSKQIACFTHYPVEIDP
jgi:hypothetical protein